MAELKEEDIFKPDTEVLTINEYIEKYGNGVSQQAVSYACEHDKLDFVRKDKFILIVMTEKSRAYAPNKNKNRDEGKNKSIMTFGG